MAVSSAQTVPKLDRIQLKLDAIPQRPGKLDTVTVDPFLQQFQAAPSSTAAVPQAIRQGPGLVESIVQNAVTGAIRGSVLIPDDLVIEPEDPMPAIQLAAAFVGGGVEGAAADILFTKGLGTVAAIARVKNMANLAKSADKALRMYGVGEDLSKLRRISGGAVLGGTTETLLQLSAGNSPEQALQAAGIVTVAGATLGGAIAAARPAVRAAKTTPRVLKAFTEEFTERGGTFEATSRHQLEAAVTVGNDAIEAGVAKDSHFVERLEAHADALATAKRLDNRGAVGISNIAPTNGTTTNPKIESMFDQKASDNVIERLRRGVAAAKEAVVFEQRLLKFPSLSRIEGLTLADDIRVLNHSLQRANNIAEKDVTTILGPLHALPRKDFKAAYQAFERIVVLRDLKETAAKGVAVPNRLSLDEIRMELSALEARSPTEVLQAAEFHRQFVNTIREDLVRRGKLEIGQGYDDYYPHEVIRDLYAEDGIITGDGAALPPQGRYGAALKESRRPRQRAGSDKPISTDYISVMHRAARRWHTNNAVDDFLTQVKKDPELALDRSTLSPEEIKILDRGGVVSVGGRRYKQFDLSGPVHYRAQSVDDEAYNALRSRILDGDNVNIEEFPELREILAVGRRAQAILAEDVATRLERFYRPSDLRLPIGSAVQRANAWWKRNTIWWGLSRFFVFQLLGDSVNLARSNPAAFLQITRKRGLDSPALRAINEIFKSYGTPLISQEQMLTSLAGGVGLMTLDQIFESEDPSLMRKAGSILMGAGLGYIAGTRAFASGTKPAFSHWYDEADSRAVLNSGFFTSTEDLARRILGEQASNLPARSRSTIQRSQDTFFTLLSGKTTGDPYNLLGLRSGAEIIEVVQRERENWLRLASYMQMVEKGVQPDLAAKRAREALVDYGKFTDTENKYFRGFLLPFYSFYRHNIPNWVKAAVGKDVGGKAPLAMAAVGALAAADIAVQQWNEQFAEEKTLQGFRKNRFHIIVGDPRTGRAYRDAKGNPMVVGWEMPYEAALEFFGLARPGIVLSELFGDAAPGETGGFFERWRDENILTAQKGPAQLFIDLLSPVVKEPIQLATNRDLFYRAPIVPERYHLTPQAFERYATHFTQTFFRQYREIQNFPKLSELFDKDSRFDPFTSAFGLGLPIDSVDLDREMEGFIHEQIDKLTRREKLKKAKWAKKIDDILYERNDLSVPEAGEHLRITQEVRPLASDEVEYAEALRYYYNRLSKNTVVDRFMAMSLEERARLFSESPGEVQQLMMSYMALTANFGPKPLADPARASDFLGK